MEATELDRLEAEIPRLAEGAFRDAQEAALAAGLAVLVVKNGELIRLHPDGSRQFIKTMAASVQVDQQGWIPVRWQKTFPD